MEFQFSTLKSIEKTELIEVFNSVFAEYFVKIELNETSFAEKIAAEKISLEKSVGAFFEGRLVGFILIGIEGETSYNGGTGVLSDFRGNDLTGKMHEFILPKLKADNFCSQQLEVITENLGAIKSYEKIGFKKLRTLVCFKGKVAISKTNKDIELRVLDEIEESIFSSFWNAQPTWQNSFSAIKRTQKLHKIIGAFYDKEFVAYIIHTTAGRIKQFAVKKEFRHLGIGQTLFSQLNKQEIIITNIDKNDEESVLFLRKLGLDLFLEQFEMRLTV